MAVVKALMWTHRKNRQLEWRYRAPVVGLRPGDKRNNLDFGKGGIY